MDDPVLQPDTDVELQQILLAASQHELTKLGSLLISSSFPDCKSVDVQDPETGFSPLHAAIAACEHVVDEGKNQSLPEEDRKAAQETVRFLLQEGAIWNQLDQQDETPGCVACRLGLQDLYELMVDAGVRAELLMNRLEGYEELGDPEAVDTEESEPEPASVPNPADDASRPLAQQEDDVSSAQYLSSTLSLSPNKILDSQSNGVMMSWESEIMTQSAAGLLTAPDQKILNIGFGMGIIDDAFQSHRHKPASHHIVEAHPAVLDVIKTNGWHDRPGVVIHAGKWQDILPTLLLDGHVFDAIYHDTFAESYHDFRTFFSEHVIGLLNPEGGRFSFFNGLGADRQISYDVYQKVVEMDLLETGFDVDWTEIDVPELEGEWQGVRRRYWNVKSYRLPMCRFMD